MLFIFSILPIFIVVLLMTIFKFPAKKALPIGWILTSAVLMIFYKIDIYHLTGYTLYGFLKSIDILVIIFGALLILNTLKESGAVRIISKTFETISPDKRVQLMIVGFGLVSFIEAAAGFGTPAALVAPLLIVIGFPPMAAAVLSLVFDSVVVCFGAVGAPVNGAMNTLSTLIAEAKVDPVLFLHDFVVYTAKLSVIGGSFNVFVALVVMIFVFGGKNRSVKAVIEFIPFLLLTVVSFFVPYVIIAVYLGQDLPSLLSSLICIIILIPCAKFGILVPKNVWDFEEKSKWKPEWNANGVIKDTSGNKNAHFTLFKALLPYLIIISALVITRLPVTHLAPILKSVTLSIHNLIGIQGLNYSFSILWVPGTLFIIVALITHVMHGMKGDQIKSAWTTSLKQVVGATITLFFGIAIVQTMLHSGSESHASILTVITNVLIKFTGKWFILVSTFIGGLGAFISGSNTVSNILFSAMQFKAAQLTGTEPVLLLSLQNIGGGIGNMICISNIVAVCTTTAINNREGKLLKINFYIFAIFAIIVTINALFYL